jgi:hypothetical protein
MLFTYPAPTHNASFSHHSKGFKAIASLGIFFYIVGIPLFFFFITKYRKEVVEFNITSSILWRDVHFSLAHFELVNMMRKFILTSASVFIYPDSASQFAFLLVINNCWLVMLAFLKPYKFFGDNILALCMCITECLYYFVALIFISGISTSEGYSDSSLYCLLFAIVFTMFFVGPFTFFVKFRYLRKRFWVLKLFYDVFKYDKKMVNDQNNLRLSLSSGSLNSATEPNSVKDGNSGEARKKDVLDVVNPILPLHISVDSHKSSHEESDESDESDEARVTK